MLHKMNIGICLLGAICAANASAAVAPPSTTATSQNQPVLIDRIAAIVNDDVITLYELNTRINVVEQQLKKQGTPLPAMEELKKQILERMITDLLQMQFAQETAVRVDDAQLDKTLRRIADENKFQSLAEFRARLEEDGMDYKKFREEIRGEIISVRLREREVDSKLVVSEGEVDNYLANQAKQSGKNKEYQLAHIRVLVPEQADAAKIQASQQRAEQALAQLRQGAEFAQVTAGFSDAQDALQGGDLGWRTIDRIPSIFVEALQNMKAGDISPVLRSSNGFHILKLGSIRSKNTPSVISQTHARHILIKTSELLSEEEAKARLLEIKSSLEKGGDFAEQAKLYSEDGSAAQGGDLGWISPADTVPEFEDAMNALRDGQISNPVQSSFGWHLIQVLERRDTDVSEEQKRQQARTSIRFNKSDEAHQDWLRQLRDRAYVEYLLDPPG